MASVDALIGVEVGSYRITSTLGVGGMGAVYLGVHPLIGKRVAIKVLHAEFAEKQEIIGRFFNEARAVSLLRHPNIVELIDFGKLDLPDGSPLHYCIMELLEGETLRDRIKRGPVDEQTAIVVASQIASAVAAAHRQKIIHRDLKPENVFLVGSGRTTVKILDFGIAKLQDQGAASVQTQAGVLLGTPSYMSPEQCMGRQVDARTDIYAAGVILFEMCTGRVPFVGEGYADLLIKQISADLPSPRSINPALSMGIERVIARALEKDPANRFQSMDELSGALASPQGLSGPMQTLVKAPLADTTIVGSNISTTMSGAAGELSEMTIVPPMQRPQGKSSGALVYVIVALVILAGGGGAAFYFLREPGPGPTPNPNNNVATPTNTIEAKKTRLHISSEPAGVAVKRDDNNTVVCATTPCDAEIPADGSLLRLVAHKDGFKDQVRAVVLADREVPLPFKLASDGPATAPKPDKTPKPDSNSNTAKPDKPHHTSTKALPHLDNGPKRLGDDILEPDLGK